MAYSDEEEIEKLKLWWHENGSSLLTGVVIALAIVTGWNLWQNNQKEQADNASVQFQQLNEWVNKANAKFDGNDEEELTSAKTFAEEILNQHDGSSYGVWSAWYLAKVAVREEDFDGAAKQLRWAMENAITDDQKITSTLRLARVLLEAKQAEEALKLINTLNNKAYYGAIQELKGDILNSLQRREEARTAYQLAIDHNEAEKINRPMLQLKLDDINEEGGIVIVADSEASSDAVNAQPATQSAAQPAESPSNADTPSQADDDNAPN